LGRERDVIGQLEPLADAHPYREQLCGLLMVAQYRTGRQADALRRFGELRRRLGEDLGIEPSAEIRELESAILRQELGVDVANNGARSVMGPASDATPDPLPEIAERDAAAPSSEPSTSGSRFRPATRWLVAVIGVLVLAFTAWLIAGHGGDGGRSAEPERITVPYQGTLVETLDGNSSGSTFGGTISGGILGHATYKGISKTSEAPPPCGVGNGVATSTSTVFTTRRGDTLLQEEVGKLCMSGALSFTFTGTFTFRGGSGCFEHATGGGDITAEIVFDDTSYTTGSSTSQNIGRITLPKLPHCPQTRSRAGA
jgi:hypothetical protein